MTYLAIFITILCTVVGQLMFKHATNSMGEMPATLEEGAMFLVKAMLNIYIVGGFFLAFVASLSWIFAVSRLELSFAYPFTSLNFVFVMIFSAIIFQEQINLTRVLGILAICFGVYLISRSQ
jgi:drug/metabolite transporter (DMT)-like permease